MGDYSIVGLVLLSESFLHASQYLLQPLIAFLHLRFLYCHFLQVHLVLLEVLEGLHKNPLAALHLLASLFGFDDAPFELPLALFCSLVLLLSLELSLFYLLFIFGSLILLCLKLFGSGLEFLLAYLQLLPPLNKLISTSALTFAKSYNV